MSTLRLRPAPACALALLFVLVGCESFGRWHADNSGTYLKTSDGTRRVDDVVVDEDGYVEVHEVDGRTVPLTRSGRVHAAGTTADVETGVAGRYRFSTRDRVAPDARSLRESVARFVQPESWAGAAGDALAEARAAIDSGSPTSALAPLYRAAAAAPAGDDDFRRELEATWGDLRVAQARYDDALEHYDAALGIGDVGSVARHDLEQRRRTAMRAAGRAEPTAWRSRGTALGKSTSLPPAAPTHSAGVVHHGVSLPSSVVVRPRSAWGARPMRGNAKRMSPIDRVTVHHSVCCSLAVHEHEAVPFLKSIQTDHMIGNGWADIGYHFVIDTGGTVWEGRTLGWQGAHAGNDALNRGNVGICLLGDFDSQLVDARQRRALDALLNGLAARYRIDASDIVTHRELKPTECPGANLQRHVEQFRQRARVFARQ